MVQSYSGLLDWKPATGWYGQAGYLRQRYPNDNNGISTAYGWLLAPLVRNPRYAAKLGYTFSYQESDHNRFVPIDLSNPIPRDNLTYSYPGEYNPYYTPHNALIHSVTTVFSIQLTKRSSLALNGSYGFQATEDAPYLYPTGPGTFERGFYKRWFHPWEMGANLTIRLLQNLSLTAKFEHSDKPYFRTNYAGLELALHLPTFRHAEKY